jgi:hypothetical protein
MLGLHKIFNYVLKVCIWATSEPATAKDREGLLEIHYTRIYRIWRQGWTTVAWTPFFVGSVSRLHRDNRFGMAVIHGGGSMTAAKKGGDKVVAFFDRHCNVIATFVAAPSNRNRSPLLRGRCPK